MRDPIPLANATPEQRREKHPDGSYVYGPGLATDEQRALALLRKMLGVATTSIRTAQVSFDGYGVSLETETRLDDVEYELVTRLLRDGFQGQLR